MSMSLRHEWPLRGAGDTVVAIGTTSRAWARSLAAAAVVAVMAACSSGDPVRGAVDDLVEAAEDRDVDAIGELLAPEFRTADGADREGTLRTVGQYLAAYRALDLEVEDYEALRQGSSARAKFRVRLVGVPRQLGGFGDLVPKAATYDFDFGLVEKDGEWLLADASWSEASAER
jgi:hypothetical protein